MSESFNSNERHNHAIENGLQTSVDRPIELCKNGQVKETEKRFLRTKIAVSVKNRPGPAGLENLLQLTILIIFNGIKWAICNLCT